MWEKNCASASARATVLHHSSPIPPITLRPPFPLHLRGGGTCVKGILSILASREESTVPCIGSGPIPFGSVRFAGYVCVQFFQDSSTYLPSALQ